MSHIEPRVRYVSRNGMVDYAPTKVRKAKSSFKQNRRQGK